MNSINDISTEKMMNPLYMAGAACLLSFVLMAIGKMLGFDGFTSDAKGEFPWLISAAVILLYILFSSVGSVLSENINNYYKKAIPAYIGLVIINSGFAYLFSGSWIDEVGSYKWIYFILTIGYLMLQLITRFINKIINMAQREDEEFKRRSSQN